MKKILLCITILLLNLSTLNSQCLTNYTAQSTWHIANNEIANIDFDSVGNVYVCSGQNISKFDGENWSYLLSGTLANEIIMDLEFGENGIIWAATMSGLLKYTGSNWNNYVTLDFVETGLVSSIALDSIGHVWVGGYNGLFKYLGNNVWDRINIGVGNMKIYIRAIETDSEKVWVGYQNYIASTAGVAVFDGNSWTTYSTEDGLINNYVNDILLENGNVWFATENGLSKFDGTNWYNFTSEDGLACNYVTSVEIDNNGLIWAGTFDNSYEPTYGQNSGLSMFDGNNWTTYTKADGLPENNITCLAIDNHGDKWIGTLKRGYSVYKEETFFNYEKEGLCWGNINYGFIDSHKNKWFLDHSMFSKFDGLNWTSYSTDSCLNSHSVTTVCEDNSENLYFGTENGVTKFDGETWTNFDFAPQSEEFQQFIASCKDLNGNLWFACYGSGLYRYDGIDWVNFNTSNGLPSNNIYDIELLPDGSLWFISDGGWLTRYFNNEWTSYSVYPTVELCQLYSIASDSQSNLWIAARGQGLLKFTDGLFELFTEDDGLFSNNISAIAVDTNDVKWIGGYGFQSFNDTVWVSYTTVNGALPGNINEISIDNENNLWIATDSGVTYYGECSSGDVNFSSKDPLIQIYPNPVNEMLYISTERECISLRIFNLNGQLVKSTAVSGQNLQINTSDFNNGLHLLEINTVDGVYRRKFAVCR